MLLDLWPALQGAPAVPLGPLVLTGTAVLELEATGTAVLELEAAGTAVLELEAASTVTLTELPS